MYVNEDMPEKPLLRRVEWFAAIADLTKHQAYDAIANGQLPPECIVRLGRRVRLVETAVLDWIASADSGLPKDGGESDA